MCKMTISLLDLKCYISSHHLLLVTIVTTSCKVAMCEENILCLFSVKNRVICVCRNCS